jgi:hypothetical protein
VWAQRPDRDDLGQVFLAVLTPGTGSGTILPGCVVNASIKGRHR